MTDETTFGVDLSDILDEDEELHEQIVFSTLSDMVSEEVGLPENGESVEVVVDMEREDDLIEFTLE